MKKPNGARSATWSVAARSAIATTIGSSTIAAAKTSTTTTAARYAVVCESLGLGYERGRELRED